MGKAASSDAAFFFGRYASGVDAPRRTPKQKRPPVMNRRASL
jgi:hypothetical protein